MACSFHALRGAAAVLLAGGCAAGPPRFAAVTSGSYLCRATVTVNTCGAPVPDSEMAVAVDGETDLLNLRAPSDGALGTAPDPPPWSSIQFGAQEDPLRYRVSGSAACPPTPEPRSYAFVLRAAVTPGEDALAIDLAIDYTGVAGCVFSGVTVDACRLAWAVDCAREPAPGP